ncbi:MAG: glycosyltransferase family 87 protein [Anaerolineae bacterium]
MSATNRGSGQGGKTWSRAAIGGLLLLLLLLVDAYALHRVYGQRLGNALDYYPFWAGGREVLNQRNPYDEQVTRSIQVAVYGRPALSEENQHRYAYPAYAPFIVFPFLLLPFPVSASLWIALQQFLLVASVFLVVRATRWPIGVWQLLLLCLAAMTFRYAMIAFVLGQTSTWVLFALSLALWAAVRGHGWLAGLALAAGLIKPQLVLLPALTLLVCSQPRRRLQLLLWLGGAIAALLVCSWLFAGPWLDDYWRTLVAYQGYSTTQFPVLALADIWLSPTLSRALNVAAIVGLLGLYAAVLWWARASGRVAVPMALAVVTTQLVVPQTGSYNLVMLVLPAVVALERLGRTSLQTKRAALVGQTLIWTSLTIVPWALLPLLRGPGAVPLDVVVLPLLVLVLLLGGAWLDAQQQVRSV